MAWWEILVGILLFIIALGVLIGVHELGHLSAAKLFHVYCFNYSIGFGPKLISSKRSEKHETVWTLRAIPLGGFVSMYGEGAELEDNEFIPPSRSLEGVARYKRAIIISAGVALNFVLGFVLILLHNGCFDKVAFNFSYPYSTYHTTMVSININDELKAQGINDGDYLELSLDPFSNVFLIQEDVNIKDAGSKYILCMSNVVTTTKKDPLISDSLLFYEQQEVSKVIEASINAGFSNDRLVSFIITNLGIDSKDETKIKEIKDEVNANYTLPDKNDPTYQEKAELRNEKYRNVCNEYYTKMGFKYSPILTSSYSINQEFKDTTVNFNFISNDEKKTLPITLTLNDNKNGFKDIGVYMKRFFYHYNASECFKASWNEWCDANVAVFKGVGMLITGQGEVSGPIGIAKMSTTILANFGFERYLYLWGMISCNLAILNLLPFPGLDGWQLVVIAYEAIRKKQIPTKVKGIISVIGLGLLFILMIFIVIKDIIGLVV